MMSPSADTLRIIGSVTGVALVLGVVVSLITHALAPQKTGDMLIQLAATFIAALLALAVGVGLFWYQAKRTDAKRRKELHTLLKTEVWETAEKLEETRADTERLMLDIVKPLIIEEAIKSGLFPCLSKDLLKLAKTYHRYNFHVTHMNEVQTRGEEAGGAYTESLPYKRADERLRQGEDEVVENSQKLLMKLCQ